MKNVLRVGVRCGMQWDLKDEIDCTVAGRGDDESKLPIFGTVVVAHCHVDVAPMMFAIN